MTHCTLLSMQSLLVDIFGPILIESFSLEEIKLQNLPLECGKKNGFRDNSPKSKNGKPDFLYVEKGPLGQYKFLNFSFLKLGADNFFARFLIFSFGPWLPLGA